MLSQKKRRYINLFQKLYKNINGKKNKDIYRLYFPIRLHIMTHYTIPYIYVIQYMYAYTQVDNLTSITFSLNTQFFN